MRIMKNRRVTRDLGIVALAGTVLFAGCDVTNPGQILDADLNQESAFRVLVTGMAGDFANALDDINWNTAVMMGDLAGTSAYLSRQRHWEGTVEPEDADDYNSVHTVRWVIEDGIARMEEVLGERFDSSVLAAEAHLWGGYANRLLGETMCQAVFDGGAPQPREAYLERAEEHFTRAIQIAAAAPAGTAARTIQTAAYGGRASVRINLGDWDGALSDAAHVPDDFVFYALYSPNSGREGNTIWTESQSRVNLNVKHTFFEDYFAATEDPRTPWFKHSRVVVAADGATEQLMQDKYSDVGADVALTRGAEMRLIKAEALIRSGEWQAGLAIINALRAAAGVEPWTASNQAEALERLKVERAIVLWMEARRAGDVYRWGGDPSEDPILVEMYENAPKIKLAGRPTCHPFSLRMMSTNPNL